MKDVMNFIKSGLSNKMQQEPRIFCRYWNVIQNLETQFCMTKNLKAMTMKDDEAKEDVVLRNSTLISFRKAKEIILQMFSDKEDAFLSDDDDMEKRHVKQRLLVRAVSFCRFNIEYG